MKSLAPTVPVIEVPNEGLTTFLGKKITLFCLNYIYSGTLEGINDTCVKLIDAGIVYETGAFADKDWKDRQKLPSDLYVQLSAIESFMELK